MEVGLVSSTTAYGLRVFSDPVMGLSDGSSYVHIVRGQCEKEGEGVRVGDDKKIICKKNPLIIIPFYVLTWKT